MTNFAKIKKIELLTSIHLQYWVLNGIGPIVAENSWNCAEHVESCRVVNWYSIIYCKDMVLLPLWSNTTIPTYMLPLLYNITFLFIYIIMVFFFCSVVSEVYWHLFGLRPELYAPFSSVFWSAKLEVLSVKYFLRPPIFDNPEGP